MRRVWNHSFRNRISRLILESVMVFFLLAAVTLAVIVWLNLRPGTTLGQKSAAFIGATVVTYGGLWFQGSYGGHVIGHEVAHGLHHHLMELGIDYIKFICIPLVTVVIAGLDLFAVRAERDTKIGWFLWLVTPVIANVATTWAMVPIVVSIVPLLRKQYVDTWFYIVVCVFFFSGNMLALGTLAADPPQAFYALKETAAGRSIGFFWPGQEFAVFLLATWLLYGVALARLGVQFGSIREIARVKPENIGKAFGGVLLAACIGVSVAFFDGSFGTYEVPVFLGTMIVVAMAGTFLPGPFDSHDRHQTMEWMVETVVTFAAFFSVVAFVKAGMLTVALDHGQMIFAVIGVTALADNAAAFAMAYEHFAGESQVYMAWYNLFPSVVFGSSTPLGNGPQIVALLVVLASRGIVTPKEVFTVWMKEASVFLTYLAVWALAAYIGLSHGVGFDFPVQVLVAIVAFAVALQFMELQRKFRRFVFTDDQQNWDGRMVAKSNKLTSDEEDAAAK